MNKPKFPNSKQVSIAIVLVCVSLIAGALIAQALTPSTTFWISPGVYPGAPSYTVWVEGTSYFAKDSLGHTVYADTNATAIIQNCIETDKTIFLVGEYSISQTIMVDHNNVTILGNDAATRLTMADNANVNMFNVTGNFTTIRHLHLRGNRAMQTNGTAIYALNTFRGVYEYLDIRFFKGNGIVIKATGFFGNHQIFNNKIVDVNGHGLFLDTTCDELIMFNDIGGVGGNAVYITASGPEIVTDNNLYMGGWNGTDYDITAGGLGVYISYSAGVQVTDNTIHHNGQAGIRLSYSENCSMTDNWISLNNQGNVGYPGSSGVQVSYTNFTIISNNLVGNFRGTGTNPQEYGIVLYDDSSYNILIGNLALDNTIIGIWNVAGATNEIHSCYNGTDWIT